MANEVTVRSGISILKRDDNNVPLVDYQGRPVSFQADMTGTKGPYPGAMTVSVFGTDVDLSEGGTPGFCRFMNQDSGNAIHVGRWDPDSGRFYPFMKLLPGESYVLRLSDFIEEEFTGTGTGTASPTSTLRAVAENDDAVLLVEAFDS